MYLNITVKKIIDFFSEYLNMMSRAIGKKIVAQDQKTRTSQETRAGGGGEQEQEPGTPRTGKESKEKRGWDKEQFEPN